MKKAVLFSITFFLITAFIFSGCSLEKPKTVMKSIKKQLPGCKITHVEESEKLNSYSVEYKGIDFTVYNELVSYPDALFPATSSEFSTDYFSQILKTEDVQSLLEKYDIEVDNTSDSTKSEMTVCVSDSARLKEVYGFLDEFYQLVYEYLPNEDFYGAKFSVYIKYKNNDTDKLIKLERISIREEIDWDYIYNCTLIDIKRNITNSTDDEALNAYSPDFFNNTDYESLPQRYIEKLYINGEEFVSEKHDIKFIYRLKDDTYYAPINLNYDYEIEDYLLKEIISCYYPDSDYTIDEESFITTYEINGNKYKMYYSDEKDKTSFKNDTLDTIADLFSSLSNNTYRFYKNNKKSDINTIDIVDGHSLPGAFNTFIKVEDWANLMEMNVDKIDESGIYLSVK